MDICIGTVVDIIDREELFDAFREKEDFLDYESDDLNSPDRLLSRAKDYAAELVRRYESQLVSRSYIVAKIKRDLTIRGVA